MLSRAVDDDQQKAAEEADYDGDDEALSLCDLPIYGDDNESSFCSTNYNDDDDDEDCFEFSFSSSQSQQETWGIVRRPHDEKNIIIFCGKMISSPRKESPPLRNKSSLSAYNCKAAERTPLFIKGKSRSTTPSSKWYNLLMFGLVRVQVGNKMELKDIKKRQIKRVISRRSTSTTSREIGDKKKKKMMMKLGGQLGTMWSFLRTTFGCTTTSHVDSNASLWCVHQ